VTYREARGRVQDGDVLLFRARGPVSRVIGWATRSRYSHVALAVWIRQRLMVAESRELRGCRIIPMSAALQDARVDRYEPPPWATDFDREMVVDAALARLGQPYGYLHLVRIALSKLPTVLLRRLPVVGRWIPAGRQWSEDDREPGGPSMICSEYVSSCYRAGGLDLVPRLADRDTTPGDLARSAALLFAGEISA